METANAYTRLRRTGSGGELASIQVVVNFTWFNVQSSDFESNIIFFLNTRFCVRVLLEIRTIYSWCATGSSLGGSYSSCVV